MGCGWVVGEKWWNVCEKWWEVGGKLLEVGERWVGSRITVMGSCIS